MTVRGSCFARKRYDPHCRQTLVQARWQHPDLLLIGLLYCPKQPSSLLIQQLPTPTKACQLGVLPARPSLEAYVVKHRQAGVRDAQHDRSRHRTMTVHAQTDVGEREILLSLQELQPRLRIYRIVIQMKIL